MYTHTIYTLYVCVCTHTYIQGVLSIIWGNGGEGVNGYLGNTDGPITISTLLSYEKHYYILNTYIAFAYFLPK